MCYLIYQAHLQWHQNVKDLGPFAKDGQLFEGPTFPVMFDRSK